MKAIHEFQDTNHASYIHIRMYVLVYTTVYGAYKNSTNFLHFYSGRL